MSQQRSQLGLLQRLSCGEIFDSSDLIRRVVDRSRSILIATDARCGFASTNVGLSALFERFDLLQQTFLVRSAPIRCYIEELQTRYPDDKKLGRAAADLQALLAELTEEPSWDAFFQSEASVVQSWPVVTVATNPRGPDFWEGSHLAVCYDRLFSTCDFRTTELIPFDRDQITRLREAFQIISSLDRGMLKDVSINVRNWCRIGWRAESQEAKSGTPIPGGYTYRRILGSSYISSRTFVSMEMLLETLYHEALHNKLFNTLFTHNIIRDDYLDYYPPQFECPWANHGVDRLWESERVIAAFHVYVHLLVYYAALYRDVTLAVVPDRWRDHRLATSHQKGIILMEWLDANFTEMLTSEGRLFFQSLRNVFQQSIALHEATVSQSFESWEESERLADVCSWTEDVA